jgi:hypothetical protein
MLWEISADPLVVDGIECRNVWLKDDPKVLSDALALGKRMTPRTKPFEPDIWARNLCVAAYKDDRLVAEAIVDVRFSERVRATMGYVRAFVAPECRERGLVIPLTLLSHEIIRKHALGNPGMRIGGTMAVITARGYLDEPVGKAFMVLIGYAPNGDPVMVRWFDHFKL